MKARYLYGIVQPGYYFYDMLTISNPNQPETALSGSTTTTSQIPLDVLGVIFRNLNPRDLSTCCRVNKAVYSLAFRALYRNLQPTRRNIMQLCLKLCNDSNLALLVRSFAIHDDSVGMYLGIIQDTLLLLPQLHTLILFIGQWGSWVLPRRKPCPFILKAFSCSFICNEDMVSFLEGQPDVKHLTLSGPLNSTVLRAITSRTVPDLTSLYAPLSMVEVLAPNRPLDVVTTFGTSDQSTTPSISCLSRTTSPLGVQRLMLNFVYLRNIGCEQLAQAVPHLVFFTIDADDLKPDDEEMMGELTEWIEEFFSYMKHLECLTIRFYPFLSITPCQEIDFSDFVTSIFAASPRLKHVVITFYGLRARYVCKQVPGRDWYIVNA